MSSTKFAGLMAAAALALSMLVPVAMATRPCGARVCAEEIMAACGPAVRSSVYRACKRSVIRNCRRTKIGRAHV